MRLFTRILLLAALFLSPVTSLQAQTAADPSGHWEGTLQVPNMEMKVEIDLARNGKGQFGGTFGQPSQGVKGLPLSSVTVETRTVRFVVKGGPEAELFFNYRSEQTSIWDEPRLCGKHKYMVAYPAAGKAGLVVEL